MKTIFTLVLLFVLFSCDQRISDFEKDQKGYLISFQLKYFYFLPATELNLESALKSFKTTNLKSGFQFSSYIPDYEAICMSMDTFFIQNSTDDDLKENRYLKITPVMISYRFDNNRAKYIKSISDHDYCIQIREENICFNYSNRPYEIINVTPLKVNKRNIIGNVDFLNRESQ